MYYVAALERAGCQISKNYIDIYDRAKFDMFLDGHRIIIDSHDHPDVVPQNLRSNYKAIFKSHLDTRDPQHAGLYAMSPMCFYDWGLYESLKGSIKYRASGKILNNQRPYCGALVRRNNVQKILRDKYGGVVDTSMTDRPTFYKKINDCLVSVCVPGATNDILDRGQLEYMAFGACTLAPPLIANLPWDVVLIPDAHYVSCAPDYSNLIDRIEWCKSNPQKCIEIGQNAKEAMLKACSPENLLAWMVKCTST